MCGIDTVRAQEVQEAGVVPGTCNQINTGSVGTGVRSFKSQFQ
jgi:hypothetical protein